MIKFQIKLNVKGNVNGGSVESFKRGMRQFEETKDFGEYSKGEKTKDANNIVVPQAVFTKTGVKIVITRDAFLATAVQPIIFGSDISPITQTMAFLFPDSLLRGWLKTIAGGQSLKKASAIKMPNFESDEISPGQISLLPGTVRGQKDDTSFRYAVAYPEQSFETTAYLDLDETLFLSTDALYDRPAVDPAVLKMDAVKAFFLNTYGVALPETAYYKKTNNPSELSEQGIVLPNEVGAKLLLTFCEILNRAGFMKADASSTTESVVATFNEKDYNILDKKQADKLVADYVKNAGKSAYREVTGDEIAAVQVVTKKQKNK